MSTEHVVQVRRVGPVYGLIGAELTYTYGSPLRVGDRVMCPATPYSNGPWIAEVTRLGSDYSGSARSLLCRVAPDRKRPGPAAKSP